MHPHVSSFESLRLIMYDLVGQSWYWEGPKLLKSMLFLSLLPSLPQSSKHWSMGRVQRGA